MPNYDYECQLCHNLFEVKVSIKVMEQGSFACNRCGSQNTRRLFNGFAFFRKSGSRDAFSSSCSACNRSNCSDCKH